MARSYKCQKCGGTGNIVTTEKGKRTVKQCFACKGKGWIII